MYKHNSASSARNKSGSAGFIDNRPDLLAAIAIAGVIAGVLIADDYNRPSEGLFLITLSIIALFVAAFSYNRRGSK